MDAQEGLPLRSHGLVATCIHGGGARFFFADHLGSPRVLTNGLGTLTGKHHYFPYGKEYAPGQDDEQQYKFTGHQRDTHGLSDYMRGRTCAYPLQRFMSVDPGRDGWNLYAYARGNPVKYVDPDGQVPLLVVGGVAAISAPVALTAAVVAGAGLAAFGAYSYFSSSDEEISEPPGLEEDLSSDFDEVEFDESADSKAGSDDRKERGRGANRRDRKQVDAVARAAGIDRRDFGGFVEAIKED